MSEEAIPSYSSPIIAAFLFTRSQLLCMFVCKLLEGITGQDRGLPSMLKSGICFLSCNAIYTHLGDCGGWGLSSQNELSQ